ncbi:hypothetical protein BJ742DRAFT_838678 [Cladochytrium replicatum]|nr:hypothetical protein BJ742DRAFT_838678 [Cladochytrium replicatum]
MSRSTSKTSLLAVAFAVAALAAAATAADARCGKDVNTKCTDKDYPCCSEADFCGRSALVCWRILLPDLCVC